MPAEKIQLRPLDLFSIPYKNFIETGDDHNLTPQVIHQFIEQLNIDIAEKKGQIKNARHVLKIEKLPPLHEKAIKINAGIEHLQDDINKFGKRKAQLIKSREKLVLKKLNPTPVSKTTITPLDTGQGSINELLKTLVKGSKKK